MGTPDQRTSDPPDPIGQPRRLQAPTTMAEAVDWFASSGVLREPICRGEFIPDFALADAFETVVSAQTLLDRGPLVLTFTLGAHSACCRRSLRALQDIMPPIEHFGATIVAITPDAPAASRDLSKEAGLTFSLLSDEGGHLAHLFGAAYRPPVPVEDWLWLLEVDHAMSWQAAYVPLPVAYVVTPDGNAVMAFCDADPLRRVDPQQVIDALSHLSSAAR